MGGLSPIHLLIFALIVLLLFGGKKLPELAKGLGEGMKEFKAATREDAEKKEEEKKS
jgi:sec-independent protein translocase protein TatA